MDADSVISRARSVVGCQIVYKMGQGGMNPDSATPANGAGECDCSGFVAWCYGVSRYVKGVPWYDSSHNGEWLNTDAIVRDANSPYGFFDRIDKPERGCSIVFPKSNASPSAGHIGLVSFAPPDWDSILALSAQYEGWSALRSIHCSSGNMSKFGHAIEETDAKVFSRPELNTIFARCALVTPKVS